MPLCALQDLAGKQTRFLFATATIPEHCLSDLAVDFEGLVPAVGRNLHRPAPGALVLVVDCSGGTEINEETGFARKAEVRRWNWRGRQRQTLQGQRCEYVSPS